MSFIVAANWKMHKTPEETTEFFLRFLDIVESPGIKKIFFIPAVNALATANSIGFSNIGWGPQNIFPAAEGAYTGETSPKVMADLGAQYVLVGHSERRRLFHETNELINKKILSAQEFSLNPVLCIGETLEERKQGQTLAVLQKQLEVGLSHVEVLKELHIAYEPVWAIGTGEVASPEQVKEAHQYIRRFLAKKYPEHHASINILYGGSVKIDSAKDLSQVDQVSGFLIGGASLKADSLQQIIQVVRNEG